MLVFWKSAIIIIVIQIFFCSIVMSEANQESGLALEEKILESADKDIELYKDTLFIKHGGRRQEVKRM